MSSALRLLFGALGMVASSLGTRQALALPFADGELVVERSESASDCPDESALRSRTLALGKHPEESPEAALSVAVALDRDGAGYVARIRSSGRKEGDREIRVPGESCAPLAEATSVALAILFDLLPPEAEAAPPPLEKTAPTVAAAPRPPVSAEPQPPPSPKEPAPAPAPAFASLSAEGGVAYGLLGSAFTGHVGGAFHLALGKRWEVAAGGFWVPGRSVAFDPGSVFVSLASGRAGATLWLLRSERLDLGGRAELLLGAIHGEGRGFDHPGGETEFWAAASVGASGRYTFNRRFGLRFGLAAVVPFRNQSFTVTLGDDPPANAFESLPVAAVLEVGPELLFF